MYYRCLLYTSVSGYQFYNTSEFNLSELVNDADHLAANFKSYIKGFSTNIQNIIKNLDFDKQIDKMDKNNRLLSVVKAFSELDLNPVTIDNVKMGYTVSYTHLYQRSTLPCETQEKTRQTTKKTWYEPMAASSQAGTETCIFRTVQSLSLIHI